MPKLIIWNLMTLDGYFEGPNRDIDWHEDVWGDELEQLSSEQGHAAGALLFGRVTYELMANYWTSAKGEIANFMNGLPKIVASRTMEKADWHNTQLIRENVPEEIARLKAESGKDIFYSAALISRPASSRTASSTSSASASCRWSSAVAVPFSRQARNV